MSATHHMQQFLDLSHSSRVEFAFVTCKLQPIAKEIVVLFCQIGFWGIINWTFEGSKSSFSAVVPSVLLSILYEQLMLEVKTASRFST